MYTHHVWSASGSSERRDRKKKDAHIIINNACIIIGRRRIVGENGRLQKSFTESSGTKLYTGAITVYYNSKYIYYYIHTIIILFGVFVYCFGPDML